MDSNGYIMLDFSPIDFSKKNQVIYGLFDRISDVKAVNKFIIILNIQGNKTPLPAVMTYINNSYVIESFLYNFTITSDDNIRIDNVSVDIIKDGIISAGSTWSSQKISDELSNIPLIDDTEVSSDTTWSSEKINDELAIIPKPELVNLYSSDTPKNNLYGFISVSDDINKYDFLVIEFYNNSTINAANLKINTITILKTSNEYYYLAYSTGASTSGYIAFRCLNNEFNNIYVLAANGNYIYIKSIKGIKLF